MASYGVVENMFVQELARDGQDPPLPYIAREDDRPTNVSSLASPIPVVDLDLLFSSDGDSQTSEMDKLRSALHSWGLFQAIGHGIPSSLIDDVGKIAREFFHLPTEERKKYSKAVWTEGNGTDEIALEGQAIDWNDQLYLLVLPEDERDLSRWPDNPSSLPIMSNGIFKSPVHRAVTNSEKERISLAMFLVADGEKEIEPADQLINEDKGQPRLYKKLKVKEYLEAFYQNFTQGKRSIDLAKV